MIIKMGCVQGECILFFYCKKICKNNCEKMLTQSETHGII